MTEAPKLYLVRAGTDGEDEDLAFEHNVAVLDYREIPAVDVDGGFDAFAGTLDDILPDTKPRTRAMHARQVWAFAASMEKDDLVVLPRKHTKQIAIGRVAGPYRFTEVAAEARHARPVQWLRSDIPRTAFGEDLLRSFGVSLTVCEVSRNNAAPRVAAILEGKSDPGPSADHEPASTVDPVDAVPADLVQQAEDQIVAHIQKRFAGHALTTLVNGVLTAEGWVTKVSPPGPEGGVDILAGRGSLGLDSPRLCVQVNPEPVPADLTEYRNLLGTMQIFRANQGLLVCWGGFDRLVQREAMQGHFTVRLWDSSDLVGAVYRNYERLPAEIQAELPLQRIWMLVPENGSR